MLTEYFGGKIIFEKGLAFPYPPLCGWALHFWPTFVHQYFISNVGNTVVASID